MNKNLTRQALRPLTLAVLGLALSAPAAAATPGESPWMVRAGVSAIQPKSNNGQLALGPISVDSQAGPTVNLVYFFSPNWAVDVLGGLPFKHDFSINGEPAGSTRHLPPTVTLQYHLLPGSRIQPYAGFGVNYTLFMNERLNSGDRLDLSNSFGLTAQAGVDVQLDRHWRLGFDLRYIDIDSRARVNGERIGTVEIDPLVYSLTLGYRF